MLLMYNLRAIKFGIGIKLNYNNDTKYNNPVALKSYRST